MFGFLLQVLLHMLCYFLLQIFIVCSNIIYYGNLLLRSLYKLSFLHKKVIYALSSIYYSTLLLSKNFFLLKIFVAHRIPFIKKLSLSRILPDVDIMYMLHAVCL